MEYSHRIQILLQFNRMYAFRDSLTENRAFGKKNLGRRKIENRRKILNKRIPVSEETPRSKLRELTPLLD